PARLQSSREASPSAARGASPSNSSYSQFKTAEERAAWVKQQAQQRMNERLAALGIRPAAKPHSPFPPEPVEERSQAPPPPSRSTNGFASPTPMREDPAKKQREEEERLRREREENDRREAEQSRQEEQRR